MLFSGVKNAGNLDYVTGWYRKATEYIQGTQIECAFVSTNSICQGQQVPILWPNLFARGVHINFAHQTFKWSHEARGNTAVYCIIVGFSLRNRTEKQLFLYDDIKGEGLFSAAEIARLKNTASLPSGKYRSSIALFHFIAKVRQFANPRFLIKAAVVEFIGTESSNSQADKCLFSRCAKCVY